MPEMPKSTVVFVMFRFPEGYFSFFTSLIVRRIAGFGLHD
jgi:hypothetical protein